MNSMNMNMLYVYENVIKYLCSVLNNINITNIGQNALLYYALILYVFCFVQFVYFFQHYQEICKQIAILSFENILLVLEIINVCLD